MNISPDGVTVRFKTGPEEVFLAEKSGAKPNTVRIIGNDEYEMLNAHTPKKIVIQYQQEIFLRTLTNLHFAKLFGHVIVIFSWANEEHHHHTIFNETGPDPYAHTMSIGSVEKTLPGPHSVPVEPGDHSIGLQQEAVSPIDERFAAITISNGTLALLQSIAHGRTMDMVMRELLDRYMPTSVEPEAHNIAIESTTSLDELSALLLPRTLIQDLGRHRQGKSHAEFIQELLLTHINKMAEERGPLHD